MKIAHLSAEIAFLAKAGGLGDVVYALSKSLNTESENTVFLPFYDIIDTTKIHDLKKSHSLESSLDGTTKATYWSGFVRDVNIVLVKIEGKSSYFDRGKIYGELDDIDRFLTFNYFCLKYFHDACLFFDVIHLHDWPTASTALIDKCFMTGNHPKVTNGFVLTIHNMKHQGKCAKKHFQNLGMEISDDLLEKVHDPNNPSLINLLKAGIVFVDQITTVSPSYAKEITSKEFGCNLDSLMLKHKDKLCGILNGIDLDYWNPKKDIYLAHNYSTTDIDKTLLAKEKLKTLIQNQLGLNENPKTPLFVCVTRLDEQKGPKLILHAIEYLSKLDAQVILLGSVACNSTKKAFEAYSKSESRSTKVILEYDEPLAHRLFASADFLIIPSTYEPCGLTQLIAMEYGTIPIARKTGGLTDTVIDSNHGQQPTGIVFKEKETSDLENALDRALELFKSPKTHKELIRNASNIDRSWNHPAKEYLQVYKRVISISS